MKVRSGGAVGSITFRELGVDRAGWPWVSVLGPGRDDCGCQGIVSKSGVCLLGGVVGGERITASFYLLWEFWLNMTISPLCCWF